MTTSVKFPTWPRCIANASPRAAVAALLLLIVLGFAHSAHATPISNLVISELMYEPTGNDNGRQWLEIFNGTGSLVDLTRYQLEWGSGGLSQSVALSGVLNSGMSFLIGGPTSSGDNGNPIYDQIFNFNPDLGDGGHNWREDGVALVEIATSVVMHIVVYGGNGSGTIGFNDEQGNLASVVDDSSLGQGDSLVYLGNGTWQVATTPTPGVVHPTLLASVPEPGSAVLLALGLVGLSLRGRERNRTPR